MHKSTKYYGRRHKKIRSCCVKEKEIKTCPSREMVENGSRLIHLVPQVHMRKSHHTDIYLLQVLSTYCFHKYRGMFSSTPIIRRVWQSGSRSTISYHFNQNFFSRYIIDSILPTSVMEIRGAKGNDQVFFKHTYPFDLIHS